MVRRLSEEERRLWARVTDDLAPLRRRRRPVGQDQPETALLAPPDNARPPDVGAGSAATSAAALPPPRRGGPPPLAPIERRLVQRVARGIVPVDARIDLHGLKQSEAESRLVAFILSAQAQGARLVLVITGKGRPGIGLADERGVLRRVVPHWLGRPDLRSAVLGFEEAHVAHGGAGALYVRLRRRQPRG